MTILANNQLNPTLQPGQPVLCKSCAATKAWVRAKRLMTRDEVDQYLALSHEQIQVLINTRQISLIRFRGEDRFDSRDIDSLIDDYKRTSQKRA